MFAPKSTSRRASREQPLSVTASDHARQAGGIRVSQETATARPRVLAQADVLQLQRTLGNRATRHVLSSTALAGSPMLQRELDVAYLKSWATNTIETDSVWTNIVDHLAGYMMLIRLDEAVSKKVAKLEDLLKDVERWLSANQTALRTLPSKTQRGRASDAGAGPGHNRHLLLEPHRGPGRDATARPTAFGIAPNRHRGYLAVARANTHRMGQSRVQRPVRCNWSRYGACTLLVSV